jgi:light-independent protochlorophyllide reductase N subunit
MIFARPRFAVSLLEEGDLSSAQPHIADQIEEIKREHRPSVIFLLSSCTPEVMKVEFEGLAHSVSTPEVPVLFVPASGLDYTFAQSEDSVLQALLPFCPVAPPDDRAWSSSARSTTPSPMISPSRPPVSAFPWPGSCPPIISTNCRPSAPAR